MKPLPQTPELKRVAERVVWFKSAADALADPKHFLAHLMTYGTVEDILVVEAATQPSEWLEALTCAPPGVFDARSWAYWNLRFGRDPQTPMPIRHFD